MMPRVLYMLLFIASAMPVHAVSATPPAAVKAGYDVYRDGMQIIVVQETFEKTGARYRISHESTPAGVLAMFVRTHIKGQSTGAITPAGLQPEQFEYGRLDDASKNVSAEFDWNTARLKMTFDGRNETIALPKDTQDRVSLMYQFMFLPPAKLGNLSFHMTNGKKIEPYRYQSVGDEEISTPLGKLKTLHLVKQRDPGENRVEVWLAPSHHYLPVKVLIVENDGARYEQVIKHLEFK